MLGKSCDSGCSVSVSHFADKEFSTARNFFIGKVSGQDWSHSSASSDCLFGHSTPTSFLGHSTKHMLHHVRDTLDRHAQAEREDILGSRGWSGRDQPRSGRDHLTKYSLLLHQP